MTIGSRIKQARQSLGLSQAELADALGITRSACSQWEADVGTGPRRVRLERLAELLEVSYEWLATGRDEVRDDTPRYLSADQEELLQRFRALKPRQREALLVFLRTMS